MDVYVGAAISFPHKDFAFYEVVNGLLDGASFVVDEMAKGFDEEFLGHFIIVWIGRVNQGEDGGFQYIEVDLFAKFDEGR